MEQITNLSDLCEYFGADEPAGLNHRIYKDTGCGASISVHFADGTWLHSGSTVEVGRVGPILHPFISYNGQTLDLLTDSEEKLPPDFNGSYYTDESECYEVTYIKGTDTPWPTFDKIQYKDAWADIDIDTPIIGFTIQTIVEGSDAEVNSEEFTLPVDTKTIDEWMEYMESEADRLWEDANYTWYCIYAGDDPFARVQSQWGTFKWDIDKQDKNRYLQNKIQKLINDPPNDYVPTQKKPWTLTYKGEIYKIFEEPDIYGG